MIDLEAIQAIAIQILQHNPGPVVRLRLLRDVLFLPAESEEFLQARRELEKSRWVQQLADEQWADGSWGRLHTRDSGLKQKIHTTEFGVERALALGLDAGHPLLQKARRYLVSLLEGKSEPLDRVEVNDRWGTGVQLFAASTLARIHNKNPVLDDVWHLWLEIARRTFATGAYDPEREIMAHRELTGASVKDSYLVLSNKYTLALLSSRPKCLPGDVEASLLMWVWHRGAGIGYLSEQLSRTPNLHKPGQLDRWLASFELLSRFPNWGKLAGETIQWLWDKRGPNGLWDFGSKSLTSVVLPFSDSWRGKTARQFDWSTRCLLLLSRYT